MTQNFRVRNGICWHLNYRHLATSDCADTEPSIASQLRRPAYQGDLAKVALRRGGLRDQRF